MLPGDLRLLRTSYRRGAERSLSCDWNLWLLATIVSRVTSRTCTGNHCFGKGYHAFEHTRTALTEDAPFTNEKSAKDGDRQAVSSHSLSAVPNSVPEAQTRRRPARRVRMVLRTGLGGQNVSSSLARALPVSLDWDPDHASTFLRLGR